jgi:hypothetical protein
VLGAFTDSDLLTLILIWTRRPHWEGPGEEDAGAGGDRGDGGASPLRVPGVLDRRDSLCSSAMACRRACSILC